MTVDCTALNVSSSSSSSTTASPPSSSPPSSSVTPTTCVSNEDVSGKCPTNDSHNDSSLSVSGQNGSSSWISQPESSSSSRVEAKWGPSYVEYIEPLTPEEIEAEKAKAKEVWKKKNPHFFVNIDDYREIWNRRDLKKVLWNPDDKKIHSTHTIYTLNPNPKLQKYVVRRAQRDSVKPLPGKIVTIARELLTEDTIETSFVEIFRPLGDVIELPVAADAMIEPREGQQPPPQPQQQQEQQQEQEQQEQLRQLHKSLSRVIITMAIGERCIVRRQLPSSRKGSNILGQDYELEIIELINIWHRTTILPSLVIDVSVRSTTSYMDLSDHTFKIHYKLYKRSSERDVDFNPDHGWTLIKDTREEGAPDVVVCQNGYDFPCLERALQYLNTLGARGRLLSGPFFAAGPRSETAMKKVPESFVEFDQVDLSKYNEHQLKNHDLLYLDVEVVDVKQPDYLELQGNPLISAESLKQRGNTFVARKAYYQALKRYQKALGVLLSNGKFDAQTPVEYRPSVKAVLLNAALAHMKLEDWTSAWTLTKAVLDMDPENVKALYRGAVCQKHLEEYEDAYRMIDLAAHLEPNDRSLRDERNEIRKKLKEIEQRTFKGFQGLRKTRNDWGITESQMEELKRDEEAEIRRREAELELCRGNDPRMLVKELFEKTFE